uniref:L-asparagine permease 1 n=1 Tax=Lygus hesperus TaxID=30085 RepID=A0A0A9XRM2_LYGHE
MHWVDGRLFHVSGRLLIAVLGAIQIYGLYSLLSFNTLKTFGDMLVYTTTSLSVIAYATVIVAYIQYVKQRERGYNQNLQQYSLAATRDLDTQDGQDTYPVFQPYTSSSQDQHRTFNSTSTNTLANSHNDHSLLAPDKRTRA